MKTKTHSSAFTLIELLVVIAIIAILAVACREYLAPKPVSSPPPVSEKTEKSEFGSPNQSPVAGTWTSKTYRYSNRPLDALAFRNGNKSMRLYILRHATAEEAASSGDDGARAD